MLISGEAGIGKTRLASAVDDIAAGYAVPVAHGYALDDPGMPPLWPWNRVAREVPDLAEALSAATAQSDAQTDTAESAAARFQLFSDVADALAEAAAEDGLVVVLDDLHWADRISLLLLCHLAAALERSRLLVVGTYREQGAGPLAELLPDLLRARRTRRLRLDGLSKADIRCWLDELTPEHGPGTEALAERLWAGTGGNPLFVHMLAERMTVRSGTDLTRSLEQVLAEDPEVRRLAVGQVARLSQPARDLLDAASVLGERINPSLLSTVAHVDAAEVGRLLDEAVAGGALRSMPHSGGIAFAHSLVRDAVYGEVSPSVRMALHRRTAEAFEQSGTSGELAGLIATHWHRADGPDAARRCTYWARVAAGAAGKAVAYDEAVGYLDLALEAAGAEAAGVRAELVLELAQAEFVAGQVSRSIEHCELASKLAAQAGRPELMAAAGLVVHGIGTARVVATADRLCAAALQVLPDGNHALHARLLARRALAASDTGQAECARQLSARALEVAQISGDPDAELDGIHARHFAVCAPQYVDERRELAHRAVELGPTAQQPLAALWGHVWLVDAAFQLGEVATVDYELGQIEQIATASGSALAWWQLRRLSATRAALVGELGKAVELNESARRVAERIGDPSTTGLCGAFLVELAMLRGVIDSRLAEQALRASRSAPQIPLVGLLVPMVHALAGDTAAARAAFEEFRDMPRTVEVGSRWAPLLERIGELAVMLGDAETADLVYGKLRGLDSYHAGDGSGIVFPGGAMARLIGDLALASGRYADAIGHYRTAIAVNARIGARPFLALSRFGLARALLAHGDSEDLPEARASAVTAAAEFRRLDLPGPLAAADGFLAGLDQVARLSNPLSPREMEVVSLVAEALSNRQIAERLVLSERTVETHVRNILVKLGYSTRTEIATWSLRER